LGFTITGDATNGQIELVVTNGESQIPNILESLHTCGVGVEAVSLKKPTLDDVFLKFTGASIEQGDTFAQAKKTRRTFRRLS
jgi:ABC-2 type transport system ATP-binding protein